MTGDLIPQHPEPGVYAYEIPADRIAEAGRYIFDIHPDFTATIRKADEGE
jgi:hypothetical protein